MTDETKPRPSRPPRDNLYRATRDFELRAAPATGDAAEVGPGRLVGHFAVFNQWTLIDSQVEGRFLERVAPGAFKKTFAENRAGIRVLFNHGKDPSIGDKVLGPIEVLEEDEYGARYEVPLLDTSYNRDLAPGLRLKTNGYGSSFRFSVVRDDMPPAKRDASGRYPDYNPEGLPERTIRELRLYEFGPVTFPAYANATASVRSMTDEFTFDRLTEDPARLRELITFAEQPSVDAGAEPHLEPEPPPPPPERATPTPSDPAPAGSSASEEKPPVPYDNRDDMAARAAELRDEMARLAVEHPGVLPDEAQARWDVNAAELAKLDADISAWDERQAYIEKISRETVPGNGYSPPAVIRKVENIYDLGEIRSTTRSREEYDQKVRDNAMRSLEASTLPRTANVDNLARAIDDKFVVDPRGVGEIANRVLLTGSPAYRRAFNKYLRGETALWTPEESRAAALAVTGTTTTGGYAVPYVFDPTMVHIGAHTSINPYRAACRVETITGGNNWKAVTVGAITAAYGTEAAAPAEGGPTFGQPDFTVQTAKAFASISFETLQDRTDIVEELTSLFGEARDTLEENKFTLGAGTTVYPLGMFYTGAFTNKDTATNDVTAITDMTALEADLPLRHRMNAAYFMSRSTQRQLEALDTTGYYFKRPGQYFAAGSAIPQNSATGNTGTQLLGYPIWEVPSAPSTLTTDGAIIVVFGDPRNYVIVDRLGMSVEVVQHLMDGASPSIPNLQRGVLCYWRNTARSLNADGMRSLSVQ